MRRKSRQSLEETSQGMEMAGKAASAVAGENQAEAGGKMVSQQEFSGVPLRFGFPMEDFRSQDDASVSGEGSNSGISLHRERIGNKWNGRCKKPLKPKRPFPARTRLLSQNRSISSSGAGIPALENAVFQSSASSFQGANEINLARMDNSAGNGFAYYDPYRSAELAQNMREQATGAGARQLVLEMEPDELGKISIKVGAKKDEISVEALTQSVGAKEALMSNAPELRQDLKDQGLVLDKFMVDVNGEKSGGGNYPEGNKAKGKSTPLSKTARAGSIQTSGKPVYIRKTDGRSQISIFA